VLRHADRAANGSLPQRALLAAAMSVEVASHMESRGVWGVAQRSLIRTCGVAHPGQWGIVDQHGILVLLSRHICHDSMKDWSCSIIVLCVCDCGRELNDILSF